MSFNINNSRMDVPKIPKGADEHRLREMANESGLLMLEKAFTEQLQAIYEEENEENGGGYYREMIPFLVQAVFKGSPELGVGDEIYKELKQKFYLRTA